MKYIVVGILSKSGLDLKMPFVFPDIIVHKYMYDACIPLVKQHFGEEATVRIISAGFVSSTAFEDDCYGESESLGVKSRPEDSYLIKMCDYGSMYA